ncbi:MAG: hypothetical protein ACOC37_04225 [Spirochaetota bacterium]
MDITEFAFRLFLLFLPGIIAFLIVDALTVHPKTTPFFAVVQSGVLGLLSYLAYYAISVPTGLPFSFVLAISDASIPVVPLEVLISAALAFPVGLAVAALIYHKVLYRTANWLHVSRKISDPGVWSHVLNLDPKTIDTQWVSIIDDESQRRRVPLRPEQAG